MHIGTTKKLTLAALGLGVAAAVAAVPAGPTVSASGAVFDPPVALAADGAQRVAQAGPQGPMGVGGAKKTNQGQNTKADNVDPITDTEVKDTSVIQYVNAIYVWVAFLGGLIAVISLIYAGYSYMASYGDPEKIANAKDIVEKTLIGLSLLILAALILNTINPRTVSDPCKPGEAGCGDIDFTEPEG